MDFEELRDNVLGLLGSSVEVEPSAVHRPFSYSTVRLAAWDAVSGGKGKLAVKSVRTGRWFMLHTTKADGSSLESREAFLQRTSGHEKAPQSPAPAAEAPNPPSPSTGLPMSQLLSAPGQASPPLPACPLPSAYHTPPPSHPPPDSHQAGYAPVSYGLGSGPVKNSADQEHYHPMIPGPRRRPAPSL